MDDRARLDARELARGWQAVLGRLELELNPYNITTWLAPARARSFDGAVLTLEARSPVRHEYIAGEILAMTGGRVSATTSSP